MALPFPSQTPPPSRGTPFTELGTSGVKAQAGYVQEEWLQQLSGTRFVRVIREMLDNAPPIYGIQLAMEMLCRGADWTVEKAARDTPEATDAQELVQTAMNDMAQTWQEFISEGASSFAYGWSLHELCYKFRRGTVYDANGREDPLRSSKFEDGKVGWGAIAIRGQESFFRWEFDPDGSGRVIGMWQQSQIDFSLRYIPMDKALLLRPRSRKDSPEGWSLYRGAVVAYHNSKRVQELELIGVYRDLAGMLVMEAPEEVAAAKPTDVDNYARRQAAETFVQRAGRGEYEGSLMPSMLDREGKPTGWKLSLLQSGGTRQNDTDKILRRLKGDMLMSALGGVLEIGTGGAQTGSYAIGDVHRNMLSLSIQALLKMFVDAFNRVAIPRLCALNGFLADDYPQLKHGDVEVPDLTQLGSYVAQLAPHGAIDFDATLKRYFRGFAKLPMPEPGATPSPSAIGPRAPAPPVLSNKPGESAAA